MTTLQGVIQIARSSMLDFWQHLTQGRRVALRPIRHDPPRLDACLLDSALEEGLRRLAVPALRKVGIHYLTMLVNRAIDVAPLPLEADVGLVCSPCSTNPASVGA